MRCGKKVFGIDEHYAEPQGLQPEKDLIGAVIMRAAMDSMRKSAYGMSKDAETQWTAQSVEWFTSDSFEPFSWRWCAEHLDIEPEKAAQKILSKSIPIDELHDYIKNMKRRGNIYSIAR